MLRRVPTSASGQKQKRQPRPRLPSIENHSARRGCVAERPLKRSARHADLARKFSLAQVHDLSAARLHRVEPPRQSALAWRLIVVIVATTASCPRCETDRRYHKPSRRPRSPIPLEIRCA